MSRTRHSARLVTLSFLVHGEDVLLMRHPASGDRFPGQWNGIGGHVEAGEDLRGAARRELREEAGLEAPDLALRGVVHEAGLLGHAHVLFVFTGRAESRELHSAEGLELRWHSRARLFELPLVHDVAALLPRALAASEPFFATETYAGDDRRLDLRFDEPSSAHVG